jgi:predicted membrane chloride channel (bestrophin family)
MLLHTLFAAGVVYVWFATGKTLGIPNVMLTVLGVVIGFVISYRASTSYDRYWTGRTRGRTSSAIRARWVA